MSSNLNSFCKIVEKRHNDDCMKIIMKSLPLCGSITKMLEYLKSSNDLEIKMEIISRKEKYKFVSHVLSLIKFRTLPRSDKNIVYKYLKLFTNYSISTLKRMSAKWRDGKLVYHAIRKYNVENIGIEKNRFHQKYFSTDISLLIETDIAHGCLNGNATKQILLREYEVFKNADYSNISQISVAHIYNIRNSNRQYTSSHAMYFKKTRATQVSIGIRSKPTPGGKPGYIRVDTVHQGDYANIKGVYHINIVDEVTQYEFIATVEKISERYLKSVMVELLKMFPFSIIEFHSDNGSEYINRYTVEILNRLHIKLTKSRSRRSNDNALVESKNGSIIRKQFGRNYIDRNFASELNEFDQNYLNLYLNYHRPCGFAENRKINKNGKIKKCYNQYLTPYEKFKSLDNSEQYLKSDVSIEQLDKIAYSESDNSFAKRMKKERNRIFRKINKFNRDNIFKNNLKIS